MTKQNNQRSGTLFSPEFQEINRRLKLKEPELDELMSREATEEKSAATTEGDNDE